MSSSGTAVQEFLFFASCGDEDDYGNECTFEGTVEAWEDPEISAWGWTCPTCGHAHEEDGMLDGDVSDAELEDWFA